MHHTSPSFTVSQPLTLSLCAMSRAAGVVSTSGLRLLLITSTYDSLCSSTEAEDHNEEDNVAPAYVVSIPGVQLLKCLPWAPLVWE